MANLLYVEDDHINALVLTKFLESHHQITIARDPEAALELLNTNDFDLILLDICLGNNDQDGTWLMQEIRKNPKYNDKKIIAITAHAMSEDRDKYLGQGFDSYLSKPINRDFLVAHVNELLTKASV